MQYQRPILIFDALNVFTRHFLANPAMSTSGEHMGGVVGFLSSVRYLTEQFSPIAVYIIWEGGGSLRRRQLFPDYKAQRRPQKLNRFYSDDIPNTTENRDDQVKSIIKCLKHVPVNQIYVSDCEADDVIGYMCKTLFPEEHKLIVSSDRDYYQLLNETTTIFRPGKKVIVTATSIKSEFNISPTNFALAKAICGDDSDNIPGLKGIGFKTLSKRFPALLEDIEISAADIIEECQSFLTKRNSPQMYKTLSENKDIIHRNLRLVELNGGMLSHDQIKKIQYAIESYVPVASKIPLLRELSNLGLTEFPVDEFFYTLMSLKD